MRYPEYLEAERSPALVPSEILACMDLSLHEPPCSLPQMQSKPAVGGSGYICICTETKMVDILFTLRLRQEGRM